MTEPWNAPPTSGIHHQKVIAKYATARVAACIICGKTDPPLMHYMNGYAHKTCIERRHKV